MLDDPVGGDGPIAEVGQHEPEIARLDPELLTNSPHGRVLRRFARRRMPAARAKCRQRCDEWEVEKSRLLREPAETSLELSDVIAQARTLLLACA